MADFEEHFYEELICDDCGYVKRITKLSRKHIGATCPQCNANTLTWQDYFRAKLTIWVIKFGLAIGWKPKGLR